MTQGTSQAQSVERNGRKDESWDDCQKTHRGTVQTWRDVAWYFVQTRSAEMWVT